MSNEVNISQVSTAWAMPGVEWEINNWTNVQPQKARFFTVVVEPNRGVVGPSDMEITRVWSTTWVTAFTRVLTYQWNVKVKNTGSILAGYILLMAETDN